jgi:hypothetical protein
MGSSSIPSNRLISGRAVSRPVRRQQARIAPGQVYYRPSQSTSDIRACMHPEKQLTSGSDHGTIRSRKLLRHAAICRRVQLSSGNKRVGPGLHAGDNRGVGRGRAGVSACGDCGQERLVEAQRGRGYNDAAASIELIDGSVQRLGDGEGADEPRVTLGSTDSLLSISFRSLFARGLDGYLHCRRPNCIFR